MWQANQLVEFLSWKDVSAELAPAKLWEYRNSIILGRLALLEERCNWTPTTNNLKQLRERLGGDVFRQLVCEPPLGEIVLGLQPSQLDKLVSFLRTEMLFVSGGETVPKTRWKLDETAKMVDGKVVENSTVVFGHNNRLVFESPYAQSLDSDVSMAGENYVPMNRDEAGIVVQKMSEVLAEIQKISANTYSLVNKCATIVNCWKNSMEVRTHSFSRTSRLGTVFMINAHLPECSLGLFAEMLIHESIHHFLSMVEYFGQFMPSSYRHKHKILMSPWTGRPLHEKNLSHAILVWFGLMMFFQDCEQSPRLSGFAKSRLEFYQKGFEAVTLPSLFTDIDSLDPRYVELLELLRTSCAN